VCGNRLLFEDRKLGGAAQVRRAAAMLYHSTVLVRPARPAMDRFLLAHRPGYRTNGIRSRPEPTVTVSEAVGRVVNLETAADAVRRGLAGARDLELDDLSDRERRRARSLVETKYGRREWNASR